MSSRAQRFCNLYTDGPDSGYDKKALDEGWGSLVLFSRHIHMLVEQRTDALQAFLPAFLDPTSGVLHPLWEPPHPFWSSEEAMEEISSRLKPLDEAMTEKWGAGAVEYLDKMFLYQFEECLVAQRLSHTVFTRTEMYEEAEGTDPLPVIYNRADVLWLKSEMDWEFSNIAVKLSQLAGSESYNHAMTSVELRVKARQS